MALIVLSSTFKTTCVVRFNYFTKRVENNTNSVLKLAYPFYEYMHAHVLLKCKNRS